MLDGWSGRPTHGIDYDAENCLTWYFDEEQLRSLPQY